MFCFLSIIFKDVLLSLGKSPRQVPAIASEKRRQMLAWTWLLMNQKRSCVSWKYNDCNVFETPQLPHVWYHHRLLIVLCFWTLLKNLWQFLYSAKHLYNNASITPYHPCLISQLSSCVIHTYVYDIIKGDAMRCNGVYLYINMYLLCEYAAQK